MTLILDDQSHEKSVEMLLQEISDKLSAIAKMLAMVLDADGLEEDLY